MATERITTCPDCGSEGPHKKWSPPPSERLLCGQCGRKWTTSPRGRAAPKPKPNSLKDAIIALAGKGKQK